MGNASPSLSPLTPSKHRYQRYDTLQKTQMEKRSRKQRWCVKPLTHEILQNCTENGIWYIAGAWHFYIKLGMITGQRAHHLMLFFAAQHLVQWHSLPLSLSIAFYFFSLFFSTYHLNWNLSYILCLLEGGRRLWWWSLSGLKSQPHHFLTGNLDQVL